MTLSARLEDARQDTMQLLSKAAHDVTISEDVFKDFLHKVDHSFIAIDALVEFYESGKHDKHEEQRLERALKFAIGVVIAEAVVEGGLAAASLAIVPAGGVLGIGVGVTLLLGAELLGDKAAEKIAHKVMDAIGDQIVFSADTLSADLHFNNHLANWVGDNSAENIVGSATENTFDGRGGDDILTGGNGADNLFGGDDNDHLYGGAGTDLLVGGSGDDLLNGQDGDDILMGDEITGDPAVSHPGNDRLYGAGGNDELDGSSGNDKLYGGDGDDNLFGGDGDDVMHSGIGAGILSGDAGKDMIYDESGLNVVQAGPDDDTIYVQAPLVSKDVGAIDGGDGDDKVDFSDSLLGVSVDLEKNAWGVAGDSHTAAFTSVEDITFSPWNDVVRGSDANETFNGLGGDDKLDGGDGADHLLGGGGNDTLYARASLDGLPSEVDTVLGGDGNDVIIATGAGHTLDGGAGDDIALAQTGVGGTFTGGSGVDQFVFQDAASLDSWKYLVEIQDFEPGHDRIVLNFPQDAIDEFKLSVWMDSGHPSNDDVFIGLDLGGDLEIPVIVLHHQNLHNYTYFDAGFGFYIIDDASAVQQIFGGKLFDPGWQLPPFSRDQSPAAQEHVDGWLFG